MSSSRRYLLGLLGDAITGSVIANTTSRRFSAIGNTKPADSKSAVREGGGSGDFISSGQLIIPRVRKPVRGDLRGRFMTDSE